jgi:protein-S-isoprenylcysteine O-methyltransferase Ste14
MRTPLITREAPIEAVGSWAFRQRSWLPVPLALILVLVRRWEIEAHWIIFAGWALVAAGQGLRLWAVRHIGVVSRTRTTRVGPLIVSGPYARTRNPLYVANGLLWTGFVLWSELLWMLPIAWAVFNFQYGAIARWEEQLLTHRFAAAYEAYALRVNRWWPGATGGAVRPLMLHPWSDVLFSERGTLMAVAVMAILLTAKELLG